MATETSVVSRTRTYDAGVVCFPLCECNTIYATLADLMLPCWSGNRNRPEQPQTNANSSPSTETENQTPESNIVVRKAPELPASRGKLLVHITLQFVGSIGHLPASSLPQVVDIAVGSAQSVKSIRHGELMAVDHSHSKLHSITVSTRPQYCVKLRLRVDGDNSQ